MKKLILSLTVAFVLVLGIFAIGNGNIFAKDAEPSIFSFELSKDAEPSIFSFELSKDAEPSIFSQNLFY
jgi:uncharacterized alpha/beta hydrolase family protein